MREKEGEREREREKERRDEGDIAQKRREDGAPNSQKQTKK